MKNFLKAVCIATVFVMILSCSVLAAAPAIQLDTPTVDKEAKTAVVSGKITNPLADSEVTILVVESTTSLSNLSDDKIAYIDQVALKEDGTFSFSLAINQEKFTGDNFKAYLGGTGVTSVADVVLNFGNAKPGDVNGDNKVTMIDYQLVVTNFNKTTSVGDANGDGKVTMVDYQLVVTNFGK